MAGSHRAAHTRGETKDPPGNFAEQIRTATGYLTQLRHRSVNVERDAPDQVHYQFLSRQLVLGWIRNQRDQLASNSPNSPGG
jgi:hypothetical protein